MNLLYFKIIIVLAFYLSLPAQGQEAEEPEGGEQSSQAEVKKRMQKVAAEVRQRRESGKGATTDAKKRNLSDSVKNGIIHQPSEDGAKEGPVRWLSRGLSVGSNAKTLAMLSGKEVMVIAKVALRKVDMNLNVETAQEAIDLFESTLNDLEVIVLHISDDLVVLVDQSVVTNSGVRK